MRTLIGLLFWVAVLVSCGGCATVPHQVHAPIVPPCPPSGLADPRGVVFVADGAGNFLGASQSLRQELQQGERPLVVQTVPWSHGTGRILADVTDTANSRCHGRQLAAGVLGLRQIRPDWEIYLVGYSAGCAVTLAAADCLPPDSVDRIVLLLPAVSAGYDLRPALSAARCGVDAFHSERDFWSLGVGTMLLGTSDGKWGVAPAGLNGFLPQVHTPADAALYTKLRQYPWDPVVSWTGNKGRHGEVFRPKYLRAYVLPLFQPLPGPPLPPPPPPPPLPATPLTAHPLK